ncbi:DUF302 domain-containing protein [Leptolyngbya sp. CCNP1308]|uniref:DUF302 domain-containing protein n=1 Tax=Leptolyngbya sp. CCNP1308 TaxID=3110255 RepID=UPI002B2179D3|nr:DUF302 domain-containing protein [Leptolyngbya sp. CCNP1308]MEA5451890.1 DUF302 domain-containing protein [Leptolyngbya sp. CCNP1308]
MTYHFSKFVDASFEEAIAQVTEALKQEGMGVLTEIDVQAAFKKKLDIDFRRYKILGACHPQIAYQMIQTDDKSGVLYPCNVVVQEHTDGRVEVSAVDPLAMFAPVENPQAREIAIAASQTVQRVIDHLPALQPNAKTYEYAI